MIILFVLVPTFVGGLLGIINDWFYWISGFISLIFYTYLFENRMKIRMVSCRCGKTWTNSTEKVKTKCCGDEIKLDKEKDA